MTKGQSGALTLDEDDRRVLAVWAAGCAERTLPLFEAREPGDTRPRDAIDGIRAFARGEMRIGKLRALAALAHAAAREASDPTASAAARAAGHAAAVAHMAAHARGAAGYAALASGSASAEEIRWQQSRASADVRAILQRLPAPNAGGGVLGALIRDLDSSLR